VAYGDQKKPNMLHKKSGSVTQKLDKCPKRVSGTRGRRGATPGGQPRYCDINLSLAELVAGCAWSGAKTWQRPEKPAMFQQLGHSLVHLLNLRLAQLYIWNGKLGGATFLQALP
ncbi:hypothetical protein J6590_045059, partial [Homalodisca vitripennis]